MLDVTEELHRLDESLELAVEVLLRGVYPDGFVAGCSREELWARMAQARQLLEGARSETAGLLLLCDERSPT